jgi:hypothetical protein
MTLVVTVDYIGRHYSVISFSSILYSITRRAMLWLYLRSDNFQSVMIMLSTRQKKNKKYGSRISFLLKKSRTPVSMIFFLKLIIWNIDIHTCLLDNTFLCPHLYIYIYTKYCVVFLLMNKYSKKKKKSWTQGSWIFLIKN